MPVDVFVFLVWAALLVAPLFREVSFWGLQFKQELEETRKHIAGQLSAMEYRIQSSVAVNPQFHFGTIPAPPPDMQLPALQEKLDLILGEIKKKPAAPTASDWHPPAADDKVEFLFRSRLQIETELRRLYKELAGTDAPSRTTTAISSEITPAEMRSGKSRSAPVREQLQQPVNSGRAILCL